MLQVLVQLDIEQDVGYRWQLLQLKPFHCECLQECVMLQVLVQQDTEQQPNFLHAQH